MNRGATVSNPPRMTEKNSNLLHNLEPRRDAYGFAVRPQHVQRFREYASIFKEEEEERSYKWSKFLERHQTESNQNCPSEKEYKEKLLAETIELKQEVVSKRGWVGDDCSAKKSELDAPTESNHINEVQNSEEPKREVQSSEESENDHNSKDYLQDVKISEVQKEEQLPEEPEKEVYLSAGVEKDEQHSKEPEKEGQLSKGPEKGEQLSNKSEKEVQLSEGPEKPDQLSKEPEKEAQHSEGPEKDQQFPKETKVSNIKKWTRIRPSLGSIERMMCMRVKNMKHAKDEQVFEKNSSLPSIEEKESPREELEETGEDANINKSSDDNVKSNAEEYNVDKDSPEPYSPWKEELEFLVHGGVPKDLRGEVWQAFVGVRARRVERYYEELLSEETEGDQGKNESNSTDAPKKWKRQIEKDIPRTFPGHPALNEHGRDSLRRLLIAYARHNPSVGYCQAMNFFAGLLLLLMPEENAFWTLVGIIDDYFDGYYTEEMIESQVDQLVFEDLMRERFPKLVNHLDYLGVQVAWICGPWFLSIFVNMLPWESVLRIWDVLLYEGNRVMLFRTALALMELYGPALVTTKDAGDAITLLQSLAGSTFDSSQLVLTACMGFLGVTEARLEELRVKHRPAVELVVEERTKKGRVWKDSKGLASKLYSFKHDSGPPTQEKGTTGGDKSQEEPHSLNLDDMLDGINVDSELDSLPDLQEQVVWLKVELCRLLEEKRSAILRAEELETALMEIVKQDNRLQLSAKVEQLEQEVADLRQALSDKKEQENAMLKVLMRLEQEQRITEEARLNAEQEAVSQREALQVLKEKYDKAMASIAQMKQRVVVAESTLEATLQYESGQAKAQSPRSVHPPSESLSGRRMGIFRIGLGWRDRNKGKKEESGQSITSNEGNNPGTVQKESSN